MLDCVPERGAALAHTARGRSGVRGTTPCFMAQIWQSCRCGWFNDETKEPQSLTGTSEFTGARNGRHVASALQSGVEGKTTQTILESVGSLLCWR